MTWGGVEKLKLKETTCDLPIWHLEKAKEAIRHKAKYIYSRHCGWRKWKRNKKIKRKEEEAALGLKRSNNNNMGHLWMERRKRRRKQGDKKRRGSSCSRGRTSTKKTQQLVVRNKRKIMRMKTEIDRETEKKRRRERLYLESDNEEWRDRIMKEFW